MTDPDLRDPHLDRAYREAPRDEPPPKLDERIRAAARRAVGTRPQSLEQQAGDARRRSWASRWRVPLSVAATLVIAATLTVMVQDEERRPRDDAGRGVSPMVVPAREAEKPAPPAASAPDAAAVRAPGSAPAPAAPVSTRPAQESAAPAKAQTAAEPAPKLERAQSVEQPAAADSVEPARELEMRRQAPAPAAAPPPPAPTPLPAPQPALKATPQTAPAGALSESLRRDRNLGDRPERASREAAPSGPRTPEAWVELIRSLRIQGREAEATAELAELRRAYPDFPLPADLGGPRPNR